MKGFAIDLIPRADTSLGHSVCVTFAGGFNSKVACAIAQILDRVLVDRVTFATSDPAAMIVPDNTVLLDVEGKRFDPYAFDPDQPLVDQFLQALAPYYPHLLDGYTPANMKQFDTEKA